MPKTEDHLTGHRFKLSSNGFMYVIGKCLMRVLRVVWDLTGNRKSLRKNHTLTLKTIGCEIKCQFFPFLLREIEIWLQNQIKRTISGIKPTFFAWIRRISKIKISHHLAIITIFGLLPLFRVLPVIGHVWNYPQNTHQSFSYHMQKKFGSISNLWPVKWSSVFGILKKS